MIGVILGVLVWSLPILGLGGATLKFIKQPDQIIYRAVAGFATLSLIANLLNFFIALKPFVNLLIWIIGMLLFLMMRPQPQITYDQIKSKLPFVVFSLLIIAFYSSSTPIYDSGLYYLQTVLWMTSYPTPLGLANLHGRLGFNSSWHSIAAIMEIPLFEQKSSFILNSSFTFLYLFEIRKAFNSPNKVSNRFVILTIIPVLYMLTHRQTTSVYADYAVAMLTFIGIAIFLRHIHESEDLLALSLLTATLALTIKVSSAPLFLLPVILIVKSRHIPARLLIIIVALLLPWALRGIILSGCMVYPVSQTCLPVEWRVADKSVIEETLWIRSWARQPGGSPHVVLSSGEWFKPWLDRALKQPEILALIPGIVAIAFRKQFHPAYIMLLAGLCFWFITAPDVRFAQGILWSIPMLGLALFPIRFVLKPPKKTKTLLTLLSLPLFLLLIFQPIWANIPISNITVIQSANNYDVIMPVGTDQCWLAPLPCTPTKPDKLIIEMSAFGIYQFYKTGTLISSQP